MKKRQRFAALLLAAGMTVSVAAPLGAAAETTDKTADMTAFYQEWKSKYVRQNPYVTDETQYYVYYSEDTYSGGEPVPVTVSEAHGYGMLIAVSMADYDPDARAIFDGMVRYYQAHPSEIGLHLMAWQQSDNGKSLTETDGADSATDGDLDAEPGRLDLWGELRQQILRCDPGIRLYPAVSAGVCGGLRGRPLDKSL